MTLSDLSSLGSFISALAVAGSLIYLGLQTHQAAKHTRALIIQGRSARLTNLWVGYSDTERVSALIAAGGGKPTPEAVTRVQANLFFLGLLLGWVDAFEQREAGLLSSDQFADNRAGIAGQMRNPAFRVFWEDWKKHRPNSHSKFKAWVDGIDASMPAMAPSDTPMD